MSNFKCDGCKHELGNGNAKCHFIKFDATTMVLCVQCYGKVQTFIKSLKQ